MADSRRRGREYLHKNALPDETRIRLTAPKRQGLAASRVFAVASVRLYVFHMMFTTVHPGGMPVYAQPIPFVS